MLKLAAIVLLFLSILFLILGIVIISKRTEIIKPVSVDNNIYDRIEVTENERVSDSKAKHLGRSRGDFIEEPPSDELYVGSVLDLNSSSMLSKNRKTRRVRETDKLDSAQLGSAQKGTDKLNPSKTDQLGLTDTVKTDTLQPAVTKTGKLGLTDKEQTDRLVFTEPEAEKTGSLTFNAIEETGSLGVRPKSPKASKPERKHEKISEETGRLDRNTQDSEKTGRLENQSIEEETGRLNLSGEIRENTGRLDALFKKYDKFTASSNDDETGRLQNEDSEKTGRLQSLKESGNEETTRLQLFDSEETGRLTKEQLETLEKNDKRNKEQKLSNYETERPDDRTNRLDNQPDYQYESKTDRLGLTDREKTERLKPAAEKKDPDTGKTHENKKRLSQNPLREEILNDSDNRETDTSRRKRKQQSDILTLGPAQEQDEFEKEEILDNLDYQTDIEIQDEPMQEIEDYYYNIDPLGSTFEED